MKEFMKSILPMRENDSSKGTYKRTLHICGSDRYRGAALLSVEGAYRSGVGIVGLLASRRMTDTAVAVIPDAIYHTVDIANIDEVLGVAAGYDSVLIGCGSDASAKLCALVYALLELDGKRLVIDADAINSMAQNREESLSRLMSSSADVILTPHPTEFSRLTGMSVEEINAHRVNCAKEFAKKYEVALLLKGYNTVVADRSRVYINGTGNSSLSKGGSGDVLSGVISTFHAQGCGGFESAVLGAYLHGAAGETLARELSEYGVLASDLPKEIARQINLLTLD